MKLPVLKSDPTQHREVVTCKGEDHCKDCALWAGNGGRCGGCTPRTFALLHDTVKECTRQCDTCAGYKTNVTAICCRSPLKDIYLNALVGVDPKTGLARDWNKPIFEFTKRPALRYKQKAINNLIFGSMARIAADAGVVNLFEDEVVFTSISFVKGMGSRFYSSNLKHYLKVAPKSKLILSTMSIDDHLERAWEHEVYGGPEFTQMGFDAWMPIAFSTYPGEPQMHRYYQFLRMARAAEWGKSWFVPTHYTRSGMRVDDIYSAMLDATPQAIFNTQFLAGKDDLRTYMMHTAEWHKFAPKDVAFYFVGAITPTFLTNVRKQAPGRECYWVSGKPMYLAVNGKYLLPDGGERKAAEGVSKRELLGLNRDVFATMVERYG